MSIVIRRLGGLTVVSALWLATLFVNLWVVLEHYLAAQSALTLLGTEGWKLGSDSLLGQTLAAFVPNGSLPQALALTLSAGLWLAMLIVTFEAVELTDYVRHCVEARAGGDDVEAQAAQWEIGKRLLFLTILGVALVPAIRWDMLLFEFRTLASSDPAQATSVVRLAEQESGFKQTYLAALATVGSWGYLGVTLASAVALEILSSRVGDKVEFLGAALDRWWNPDDGALAADDATPEDLTITDAPTDASGDEAQDPTTETPVDEPAASRAAAPPAPVSAVAAAPAAAPTRAPLFPPEIAARPLTGQPLASTTPGPRSDMPDLREVIGGRPGERVSLSDARRQGDRYHIDLATNSVWTLDHWESLHGVVAPAEGEGRAA